MRLTPRFNCRAQGVCVLLNGIFVGLVLLPVLLSVAGPAIGESVSWIQLARGIRDWAAALTGSKSFGATQVRDFKGTPRPEERGDEGFDSSPEHHELKNRIATQLKEAHDEARRLRFRVTAPFFLPCVFVVVGTTPSAENDSPNTKGVNVLVFAFDAEDP